MILQLRQLVRGFVVVIALTLIIGGLARQNYGAVGLGVVVILAVLLDLKKRQLAQGFLVIIALVLITAGTANACRVISVFHFRALLRIAFEMPSFSLTQVFADSAKTLVRIFRKRKMLK